MKKYAFDTNFLLGLHLLLRQIELSIDRNFNRSWNEMASYFSDRGAITAVLEKLKITTTIGVDRVTIAALIDQAEPAFVQSSISRRIKALLIANNAN